MDYNQHNDLKKVIHEFEKKFKANLFLKDTFARIKNQTEYSLFGYSKEVYIGQDEWMEDWLYIEQYQPRLDYLEEQKWNLIKSRIRKFKNYFLKKNIHVILLPVPLKNNIYKTKMPEKYVKRPELNGYKKLIRFLNEEHIDHIDVVQLFTEHQENLYYKTDLHWNYEGAHLVGKALFEKINSKENLNLIWPKVDWMNNELKLGSSVVAMNIFSEVKEPYRTAQVPDAYNTPSKNSVADVIQIFENKSSHSLPNTVLVGNSFTITLLAPPFSSFFSKLSRCHDLRYFEQLTQFFEQPENQTVKYVIWQFVETQLVSHFLDDNWWKQFDTQD